MFSMPEPFTPGRARLNALLAIIAMALSTGALVWSGAAMIGMGFTTPGYFSIGAGLVIMIIASQLSP